MVSTYYPATKEFGWTPLGEVITRREERIKVEGQLAELDSGIEWESGTEDGKITVIGHTEEYFNKRKSELEQKLKSLDGQERL